MKQKQQIFRIVLAAILLSLSYVLPFLTGQIPEIGSMLCPMHIPVILCGFLCGWKYGVIVGFIAPIIRSLTLGMPPLFPTAVCMAFELATYGFFSGLLYNIFPKKNINIYIVLLISMIMGRVVWGSAMLMAVGFDFSRFNISVFWSGAVVSAIPGILIQLIIIPIIIMIYEKNKKIDL